ncbi:transcription factor HIVEP3 isoform X2 [Gadus macrocephalus]|uniref:transcription factor HIVEP3 isoform X2 n=1 Tax=Gadus macrocephalus TaxID=80720 RepID=UPI0028CBBC5A|nr:transcription factor HIVEP3 isoform X2 [Gadus macrocephalus]
MEGSHSGLTTGELPGGQGHPSHPESPLGYSQPKSPSPRRPRQQQAPPPQKPNVAPRPTKQPRRTHPQRKRLKHQLRSVESDAMTEGSHAEEATTTTTKTKTKTTTTTAATAVAAAETTTATKITSKVTRVPGPSSGVPVCSATGSVPADQETPEGAPKLKRERKPPRPGKYVCSYCGRACAKPSVLQKHIRSHTGERPYPCAPCGFSFKTKSNLYKHRKSHTHRVKAGLAFPEPRSLEEQGTESEEEAKQCPSSAAGMERQSSTASTKGHESDGTKDSSGGMDDSFAVKKRLAMRLSRGKRGPLDSSEDRLSSSLLGSRGSTESGYFSRSESTEQTQDSPPNTSAKSYAEIILGKYGRLGHLQRMSRQQNQQLSGEEEKNIPFTVPKKQVIDHITKLITINEAVVDTSKIDSVKPRRFSLSRKASSESQKSVNIKEPIMDLPKSEGPSYKNSGSITMGVPCERFQHQSQKVDPLAPHTTPAPLLRSQSMPFTTSSLDASGKSPPRFRQSQSFEQRTPSQLQTSRRFGTLRRQPAVEIPLGAELPKEDHCSFHTFHPENLKTTVPDHTPPRLQPYKSEACGTECKTWEGYKPHKQGVGSAQNYGNVSVSFANQKDHPKVIIHSVRPGAQAMRKRRKEESLESDDPSSPVACPSPSHAISAPPQCRKESAGAHEDTQRPKPHTLSVIQHTSSFEKQDTSCAENTRKEPPSTSPTRQDHLTALQKPPHKQHPTDPTPRNLVHPQNVRVPKILVTEDSNMDTQSSFRTTPASKQPEKQEEFQWPQRSPTLAQLPIEKLPPKKKRLRLAELAQSSGESSFDSGSLPPRSPSQDSSASYASSRSASFEESGRLDLEVSSSATPLRRSRASHTLTVPGVHPHREMRRSASEQAPHDAQQGALMYENRSKSFDYSCLSPERSAVGWRERRKCLLLKHSAVRDPEEEVEEKGAGGDVTTPSARLLSALVSGTASSSDGTSGAADRGALEVASPLSDDRVSGTPARELFSQWKLSQNIQLTGRGDRTPFDGPAGEGSSSVQTGHPPGLPPRCIQHYPGTQGLSGAARAHYLPMSTGLKLEIPSHTNREYYRVQASPLPTPIPSPPNITINPELLRPLQSPSVAVRLQADTFLPACAIYTTQSQSVPPGSPLRPTSIVPYIASASTSTPRGRGSAGPEASDWSEDLLRPPGTGGSKRMLSPSNSIEFSPESQQQQKRVKEEQQQEEEEERGVRDKALVDAGGRSEEGDNRQRPGARSTARPIGASCLSLESGTSNSWCYLNYMKPNPFALDESRPSVYSTWSTGSYNPNPPGMSSRTALSLLQCKQSLGPTIYTTCPMGLSSVEPIRAEDHQRPVATEVSSSLSCDREHASSTREEALSAEDRRSNKGDEEEREEEEGPNQAAKYRHPPQPWTCGEGSRQQSGLVYDRGGQGNLTQHTKVPGKTHYNEAPPPHHTDEGVFDGASFDHVDEEPPAEFPPAPPQEQSGTSDINNNNEEDDPHEDAGVKGRRRAPPASPTNQNAGEPGGGAGGSPPRTPSAGSRRALFARRQLSLRTPPPPETPPPRTSSPSPDRHPATVAPATGALARTRSPPGLPRPHSPPPVPAPAPAVSPSSSPGLQIHPSPVGGALPCGVHSLSSAPKAGSSAPTAPPPRLGAAAGIGTNTQAARTLRPDPLPPPPRSPPGLLSHLPLHSQQPAAGAPPGLTIAIGGIHMIQPRRAPPYRPACGPGAGGPSPLRGRLEQEEEEEQEEEAGPSPSHGDGRGACEGGRGQGGRKPPGAVA